MIDTVAFDSPSLETFHEINEELGSIYVIYTKKMEAISRFKVQKYKQIMTKIELTQRQLDLEAEMKEKQLEELKL